MRHVILALAVAFALTISLSATPAGASQITIEEPAIGLPLEAPNLGPGLSPNG